MLFVWQETCAANKALYQTIPLQEAIVFTSYL